MCLRFLIANEHITNMEMQWLTSVQLVLYQTAELSMQFTSAPQAQTWHLGWLNIWRHPDDLTQI